MGSHAPTLGELRARDAADDDAARHPAPPIRGPGARDETGIVWATICEERFAAAVCPVCGDLTDNHRQGAGR